MSWEATNWLWIIGQWVVYPIVTGLIGYFLAAYIAAHFGINEKFFVNRRRDKALRSYFLIRAFVEGRSDFHAFLIMQAMAAVMLMLLAVSALIMGALALGAPNAGELEGEGIIIIIWAMVVFAVLIWTATLVMSKMLRVVTRYNNFQRYEAEIQRRYGIGPKPE